MIPHSDLSPATSSMGAPRPAASLRLERVLQSLLILFICYPFGEYAEYAEYLEYGYNSQSRDHQY